MRGARGFTLLEVLIAMAILAVALSVLVGTQSRSAVQNDHARQLQIAAMLANDRLLAEETRLQKEGFQLDQETDWGDFREQGYDDFEWEVVVDPIELDPETLSSQLQGQLLGTSEEGGTLSGSQAVTDRLPDMLSWVTLMLQNITEQRIRRVSVAVTWEDLRGEHTFTAREFVVLFEPPENGNGQFIQSPGGIGGAGGLGGAGTTPGMGGMSP